ncbi:MAG: hypothetical protein IT303_15770 [Dehalococcoidia bacterium]|nr:hypothetical protein [Dehalococcoidia bacterium]
MSQPSPSHKPDMPGDELPALVEALRAAIQVASDEDFDLPTPDDELEARVLLAEIARIAPPRALPPEIGVGPDGCIGIELEWPGATIIVEKPRARSTYDVLVKRGGTRQLVSAIDRRQLLSEIT